MDIIVNNVHSQIVYAPNSAEYAKFGRLLREYLRVKVANTHYIEAQKWDGYRYFISDSGTFATGYLSVVIGLLENAGANINLRDERKNAVTFNTPINRKLPNGWSLEGYEEGERGYQGDIVEKAIAHELQTANGNLYFPRGIIDAATNAGKNSIIASIVQNANDPKVLLLCRGKTTFDEAVKFFSPMFKVGLIKQGKFQLGPFTIAMQKTLYNRAKKDIKVRAMLGKFNILFSDEAHESGSVEYSRLMTWIDAYARYFVSGTPLDMDNDVTKMIIVGMSGRVIAKISNDFLIKHKVSLRPIVKIKLNKNPKAGRFLSYDEEYYSSIKYSEERIQTIIEEVRKRIDQKIYIAFWEHEHGEYIFDRLWECPDIRPKLDWCHGEDPERDIKVENFKNNKIRIFVCSLILKQSINIPDINALILCLGGKSKITVKQLVGRLVRNDGISETVDIVDFYDVGKWVEPHSRKRLRYYIEEGFEMHYNYPTKKNGILKKDGSIIIRREQNRNRQR